MSHLKHSAEVFCVIYPRLARHPTASSRSFSGNVNCMCSSIHCYMLACLLLVSCFCHSLVLDQNLDVHFLVVAELLEASLDKIV